MRVRGLQHRGLAAPCGEQRLDLSGAFCCVESPSAVDARGLAWLIRALLQPARDLATLAAWSPAAGARVAAWLESRGEAFVLAADATQQRLQLGRWDAASAAYRAQSSDPAEIAAFFAERCWLDRLDFELLRTWGVTAPECWPASGPEEDTLRTESSLGSAPSLGSVAALGSGLIQVQVELERSRAEQTERAARIARRDELRAHCQRVTEQERELAAARAELEEQAPLAELADGLDQRVAAFRAAQEARDSGRQEIQGARRTLLAERSALRAARDRRRAPFWLGLAALALGGALPALGEWLGLAVAALGGLLAGIASLQLRDARRRLGRIEAVLAAQRMRERTGEQRFESETEPLRAALAALDLQGIDQLRGALDAHLALAKRAADLQAGLDAALPAAVAQLESLEHALEGPDPAERIEQLSASLLRERAVVDPSLPARAAPDPEDLVAAAARGTALDAGELRGRLAAALPLYLSALCAGDLTHARHRASEGWVLRGPTSGGVYFRDLPVAQATRVSLAFQLALAERTAAERSAPFVIGPDLPELDPDETRALARALRRLAGFVQVIRIAPALRLPAPA